MNMENGSEVIPKDGETKTEEAIYIKISLDKQMASRARDYKEISSMNWCSTRDFLLNKQKTQKW